MSKNNNNNNRRRRNNNRRRRRPAYRNRYVAQQYNSMLTQNVITSDSVYVKLAYNEIINRAPGTISDNYVFSLNSANRPNITGTSNQPTGFDQYALLFARYEVIKSSCQITLMNKAAASNVVFSLFPSADSTALFYTDAITQPYSVKSVVGPILSGNSIRSISKSMGVRRLAGRTTADNNFTAPVAGNPSFEYYWQLSALSADGTSNLSYSVQFQMFYWVKFFIRQVLADV